MKKRNVMKLCVLMLLMAMLFSGCDALRESDPNKDYSGETDAPTESVSASETAEPSDTDTETKPDGQPEETEEQTAEVEPQETEGQPEETEEQTAEVESATEEAESTEPASILYEEYRDMSASEQKAYFESFSSTIAFFEWFNAAKKDYADRNPGIEIDTGVVYP